MAKVRKKMTVKKRTSRFDSFWAKLIRMSGNPEDVNSENVQAMKASLRRLDGISPGMRQRLADGIGHKQSEVYVRDMG